MNLTLLASAFAEFMKDEWLGLVASAIILVSFLMTNQIKTRLINMVGCIAFVIYGLILPSYSTAIMNGGVFIVHVVFLTKHFLSVRKEKISKSQALEADNGASAEGQASDGIREDTAEGQSPQDVSDDKDI